MELANFFVNSYWDTGCDDYAGSATLDNNFGAAGGPAGSYSAMFVAKDSCEEFPRLFPLFNFCFGYLSLLYLRIGLGIDYWEIFEYENEANQVDNPRVWTPQERGQCVTFPNGVQAVWQQVYSNC
jgi:hypothetical protein